MRVLHLPTNIASQMSVAVMSLRRLGVEARGLVRDSNRLQDSAVLEQISVPSRRRHPIRGTISTLRWWAKVSDAFNWADVVHWHFGDAIWPANLDLKHLERQKKGRVVEFWGSDIRIPEVSARDNQYLKDFYLSNPELAHRAREHSLRRQSAFASHGFAAIVSGHELYESIDSGSFDRVYQVPQRLLLEDYRPVYPAADKKCPVIVHAPSNKAIKGTKFVLRAIENLQDRLRFDFRLIHNVNRREALRVMAEADIMLDQFVIGEFGLASLEAMAMGKPTICYIKPSVRTNLPADFPIVNATPDNLTEVLEMLIVDGLERHRIGRLSRQYVERYHDARLIATQLLRIYESERSHAA